MKKHLVVGGIFAIMLSLALLAGCASPPPPAGGDAGTAPADAPVREEAEIIDTLIGEDALEGAVDEGVAEGTVFTQSPFLDARVASGELPPVDERLPNSPKVWNSISEGIMPFEIGRFSEGPLRTIRMDPTWDATLWAAAYHGTTMINSPDRIGETFTPNVLYSFELSDDLMEFTFTLREGMRWSDGHPVTTEDVYFAWNYDINDSRIRPNPPTRFRAGGTAAGNMGTLTIIDRYTFRYNFDQPFGGFVAWSAFGNYMYFLLPGHYLRDFHIDLADEDTLRAKVEDAGFIFPEEWNTFWTYHRTESWHQGRTSQMVGNTPTLAPWQQTVNGDLRIFERNPFYFKVDPIGQQLPYIDVVHSMFVTDLAAAGIRMLAGEIDHAYEWIPLPQVPLFIENEAVGDFRVITTSLLHRTDADLFINQTYDDEAWRSVAQDVRFRRALSRALNREDIVEAVYLGFARVSDIQDPTYDFDYAMALLDEMGMEFGSDGFRTAPDGSPLIIDFIYGSNMAQFAPTAQIANDAWTALGLNINFRHAAPTLVDETVDANAAMIYVAFSHGPVIPMFDDWQLNRWGRLWNLYRETNGAQGEPFPQAVGEFYEKIFSIRTIHPNDIPSVRQELRRSMAENYWFIMPVEDVVQVTMAHNDLRNVPDAGFMITGSGAADAWFFATR